MRFFSNIILFMCLAIFGCTGSLLLCMEFLQLRRAGAALHLSAQVPIVVASLVAEHGL